MKKSNQSKDNKQSGGITHKQDKNAGSGAFNQGSEQDPAYDHGITGDQNDPKKLSMPRKSEKRKYR